jgi:hypothetical protein
MSLSMEDGKLQAIHSENGEEVIPIDPKAEKKLVRKIDLYLMPSVFVLYLFSYVVRYHDIFLSANILNISRIDQT